MFLNCFKVDNILYFLKILLTVDRYLNIRAKNWKKYAKPTNSVYVTLILAIIMFCLDFHLIFLNGYSTEFQNKTLVICYASETFPGLGYIVIWHRVIIQ
jgi:hypothetical protein